MDTHFGKYRGIVADDRDPNNQGRLKVTVPAILGDVPSGWAYPALPYAGPGMGFWMIPPVGAGVWVEFEAGDVSNPIWSGCWWAESQRPADQNGQQAVPTLKIARTQQGMLLAFDDDAQTISLSDGEGSNFLEITVEEGAVTIKAAAKVVVDAPIIQHVDGASHPAVFGDQLLEYLNQVVSTYQSHVHAGQMAGTVPVSPAPPVPPLPPATTTLISTRVTVG